MGRLLLEIIVENTQEHLREKRGVTKEGPLKDFVIADGKVDERTGEFRISEVTNKVPYSKGRIMEMAPDAFGERFKQRYGNDVEKLELNDIVWFVPFESYKVDVEGKYHMISDQDIVAFERG